MKSDLVVFTGHVLPNVRTWEIIWTWNKNRAKRYMYCIPSKQESNTNITAPLGTLHSLPHASTLEP